jgi:hypothetical protein
MTTASPSVQRQAANLVTSIKRRPVTSPNHQTYTRLTISDLVVQNATPPALTIAPVTRAIGPSGRIRVSVNNQSLTELLGWAPGPLTWTRQGAWTILTPDASKRPAHRNDGRCSYLPEGRLRVSEAACRNLGLSFGDEVMILVLPELNSIALTHPARILTGAPLDLIGASNDKH